MTRTPQSAIETVVNQLVTAVNHILYCVRTPVLSCSTTWLLPSDLSQEIVELSTFGFHIGESFVKRARL